jgi:hypothetical protein
MWKKTVFENMFQIFFYNELPVYDNFSIQSLKCMKFLQISGFMLKYRDKNRAQIKTKQNSGGPTKTFAWASPFSTALLVMLYVEPGLKHC